MGCAATLIIVRFLELAEGQRMVGRIERRFGVRSQPIMIFPFERSEPKLFALLVQAGFLASVEKKSLQTSCSDPHPDGCPGDSLASRTDPSCGFNVLYRYSAVSLTRDRMLAMAALGLPIIAFAHPEDLRLRRFSGFWDRGGDVSHFDEVLKFASSKRLPSRSLEEIAAGLKNIHPDDDRLIHGLQARGGS
jgi:hypothetical protein